LRRVLLTGSDRRCRPRQDAGEDVGEAFGGAVPGQLNPSDQWLSIISFKIIPFTCRDPFSRRGVTTPFRDRKHEPDTLLRDRKHERIRPTATVNTNPRDRKHERPLGLWITPPTVTRGISAPSGTGGTAIGGVYKRAERPRLHPVHEVLSRRRAARECDIGEMAFT